MKMAGEVFLDTEEELAFLLLLRLASRLRCRAEVAFLPIFLEGHDCQ